MSAEGLDGMYHDAMANMAPKIDPSKVALPNPLTAEQLISLSDEEYLAELERVRQHYRQVYLRSPLYQQKAKDEPDFMSRWSPGGVR